MESDIRYYRRRAYEEMAAAGRAVTEAARQRRLALVDIYVEHLKDLDAPNPFSDEEIARLANPRASAFGWPAPAARTN